MNDLLVKLRKAYPDKYADLKKAYEFAEKAHAGQKRSSGSKTPPSLPNSLRRSSGRKF